MSVDRKGKNEEIIVVQGREFTLQGPNTALQAAVPGIDIR